MSESILRQSTVQIKTYKIELFDVKKADGQELKHFEEEESKLFHATLKIVGDEHSTKRRQQSLKNYESIYTIDSTHPTHRYTIDSTRGKTNKVKFDLDGITERIITFDSPQLYHQDQFVKKIALLEATPETNLRYPTKVVQDVKTTVENFENFLHNKLNTSNSIQGNNPNLSKLCNQLSLLQGKLNSLAPEKRYYNYTIVTSITLTMTAICAELELWEDLDRFEVTFCEWQMYAFLTTEAVDTLKRCGYFDIVKEVYKYPLYLADTKRNKHSGWDQTKLNDEFEKAGKHDFRTPSSKPKPILKPFQWDPSTCVAWRRKPRSFTIHAEVNSLHGDVLRLLSRNRSISDPRQCEESILLNLSRANAYQLKGKAKYSSTSAWYEYHERPGRPDFGQGFCI